MRGAFCLILHAHLPFVRHPESSRFLEESWLYEAITESYLPLLQFAQQWERDGIKHAITLSVSPTLCSMLVDPLLRERYTSRLDQLVELSEREVLRTILTPELNHVARFCHERFLSIREVWEDCGQDIIAGVSRLQKADVIEVITTAATHGLLPMMAGCPGAIDGQIYTAIHAHEKWFAESPAGFWLPECAYSPEIERHLAEAGIQWTVTDSHGLLNGTPPPRFATLSPVITKNGLIVFGRDYESARQVWSRHEGYPGDETYRDFYRDLGFDAELEYVRSYLPCPDVRGFTGMKYHAIARVGGEHQIYDPVAASIKAREHAAHFVESRDAQFQKAAILISQPPVIVSPYDAELFGHWWFEGPQFLDSFVRSSQSSAEFQLTTPSRVLTPKIAIQASEPAASTWGEGGYYHKWMNESTDWILNHLHVAQRRMTELANCESRSATERALLNQAARELLLAQSSDWPFIISSGTSVSYAKKRLTEHLLRFNQIHEALTTGTFDVEAGKTQNKSAIFPEIDYRNWRDR